MAQRAPAARWYSFMSGPVPIDLTPDWRVMLYCVGLAIAAAVIAGLSPAVESLRPELAESLKASGASVTSGRRRTRLRGILVGAQIALSLLLLVEVGLVLRAQQRVFNHDPGFETRQVLSVTLTSVLNGFAPNPSFYRELESRVRALPGVLHTSFASIAPWAGRNSSAVTEIDGTPVPATRDYRQHPAGRAVSPEYFAALDVPLIRGRIFTRDEASSQMQVIPTVISETMARRHWPGQDPIGHRFRMGALREVIGVSRDVQSVTFMADDGPFYYAPLDTDRSRPAYLLVRVAGDPQVATASLRNLVRQVDPQMAVTIATLESTAERYREWLTSVTMYSAVAGLLALLLALTGVYAVVSFSVSQRVAEIAIRLALGARKRDIISLVLRSGGVSVGGGLLVGMALALAASAAIEATVLGFNARDPLMLAVVPVFLLITALGAIWIPARRAASLDPTSSLRSL
jgi:predicted permease